MTPDNADELAETRKALLQMQKERDELDRQWHAERRAHLDYKEIADTYGMQRDNLTIERDKWKALADRLYDDITRQLAEPSDSNSGVLVKLATMIEAATKGDQ